MDDQTQINKLFESINKSAEERKKLEELILKNESAGISTQTEKHQITLMRSFLISEISETVECYNTVAEFINSIFVLKSSEERDSQEIVTKLTSQKDKLLENLQKLLHNADEYTGELLKLNTEKQIILDDKQQLAMAITEMKNLELQVQSKINVKENLQKDVEEKVQTLRGQNQELLSSIKELEKLLNCKTIDMEKCEREGNDNFTAAKISLTEKYNIMKYNVQLEYVELEKTWKLDRLTFQEKFDELKKDKKDKELNLQMELDDIKRESDHLNYELNRSANDVQILHEKNNEIHHREKQLESNLADLGTKLNLLVNETTKKEATHRNLLAKRILTKAEGKNQLKMRYEELQLENALLKKQINPRTAISSSQVTSTSVASQTEYEFDLTSDEQENENKNRNDKKI